MTNFGQIPANREPLLVTDVAGFAVSPAADIPMRYLLSSGIVWNANTTNVMDSQTLTVRGDGSGWVRLLAVVGLTAYSNASTNGIVQLLLSVSGTTDQIQVAQKYFNVPSSHMFISGCTEFDIAADDNTGTSVTVTAYARTFNQAISADVNDGFNLDVFPL